MIEIAKIMARAEQRTGAAISAANREGRAAGWVYNPTRAQLAYEDARMLMGVTDGDQYYA